MPISSNLMAFILDPWGSRSIDIDRSSSANPLYKQPIFAPLLFPNESSDARDHCANERTFLSWLRLSVYMSIVSVAIILSFHLKSEASSIEKRISLPVGLLFWLLSLGCLINGLGNYLKTVRQYAQRRALVQSGWKTQVLFTIVSVAIVAICVLFLSTNARSSR